MNEEQFLEAIREDPAEPTAWLALADWLEERGDPRGELLRLTRILQQPGGAERPAQEERLRYLLARGMRPCWPRQPRRLPSRVDGCRQDSVVLSLFDSFTLCTPAQSPFRAPK